MENAHQVTLEKKFDRLRAILSSIDLLAVAYSAGVDSTVLLAFAAQVMGPERVVAVTADSPSLPREDLAEASRFAALLGVRHEVITTAELDNPDYAKNPNNRCYFCKNTLYADMGRLAKERGWKVLASGTNADDFSDYRPGLRAAREHDIREPLAEAGLTKNDLRILSKRMDLPVSDKPASPCLASRIPYGEEVTREKLRMVEAGESFLRDMGLKEVRVRHHGKLARIEVPAEWIPMIAGPENAKAICRRFYEIGFAFVSLDLAGFRSGRLNEAIGIRTTTRGSK